jgi:5-methylcytosine-specific restriction endonuclease McrA
VQQRLLPQRRGPRRRHVLLCPLRRSGASTQVAPASQRGHAMILDTSEHWCVLCAMLDGIAPPSDPVADARRAKREKAAASLAQTRAAIARKRERRKMLIAQKQASEFAQRRRQREAARRRAAREAAAPGFATPEQLAARWAYYSGRCWMCGGAAEHMDHVKPLAAGGAHWPSNQRPACWPCNQRKGARWPYPTRLAA